MSLIPLLQYYYAVLRVLVRKVTRKFVREDAVPRHPSTGKPNQSRITEKDTLYYAGVPYLTIPPPPPHPRESDGVALMQKIGP